MHQLNSSLDTQHLKHKTQQTKHNTQHTTHYTQNLTHTTHTPHTNTPHTNTPHKPHTTLNIQITTKQQTDIVQLKLRSGPRR